MEKIYFKDDYADIGHPSIIEAFSSRGPEKISVYGNDHYSKEARALIRHEMQHEDALIYFVSGGTQANMVSLSAILKPYEAVIACASCHIIHHEAGAIEATGHKIIYGKGSDGKLTPEVIQEIVGVHTDEHMVHPRVVFLSQATEMGTVYTKQELLAIRKLCDQHDLYLYVDGARLASGVVASDVSLEVLAQYADVFYIGGTKNGGLLGEAIVVCNSKLQDKFVYNIKQRGALLAKGSVLGIQFSEFFRDGLFYEIAKERHKKSMHLRDLLQELGINFLTTPQTNQLFPIVPVVCIEELKKKYEFYEWRKISNEEVAIRLVVSCDTRDEDIASLIDDLKKLIP